MPERRHLLLLADAADVADAGVVGDGGHRGAGEHEVDVGARLLDELAEVGEQGHAALVLVDPTDIEDEGTGQAVPGREVETRVRRRKVEPGSDHRVRYPPVSARVLHQGPLLRGQVEDAAGGAEQVLEDTQLDGRVLFRRRHEDGPIPHHGQAVIALVVPKAIKEEAVKIVPGPPHPADERRRERAVLADPGLLLLPAVCLVEAQVAERGELPRVSGPPHGVAVDGDAAHDLGALRVVVPPLEVVERPRGEHLDVMPSGQALGQPAAVQLRPAGYLQPVPLDDEGEPHPRPPPAVVIARSRSYFSTMRSQA